MGRRGWTIIVLFALAVLLVRAIQTQDFAPLIIGCVLGAAIGLSGRAQQRSE
jgi:hypothetical protein